MNVCRGWQSVGDPLYISVCTGAPNRGIYANRGPLTRPQVSFPSTGCGAGNLIDRITSYSLLLCC